MFKKGISLFIFGGLITMGLHAQHVAMNGVMPDTLQLNEIIINGSYANEKTPLTTSEMKREELQEVKILPSIPYMLELEPSVVVGSENGMVGVTNLRIRGVDATRINVNINGITLNDPESQSVYWYNIPNLGGMAQNIQLQRGVSASIGGSAAFGGAMNLQTFTASAKPYGQADLSFGSFNTKQYGFTAGTGTTKHGFSFDAALNGLTSDGFQRGGQTDQKSAFINASWHGKRSLLKAVAIIGDQHSGITWEGAYAEDLDADPHYNGRGKIKDAYGNVSYYDNETDNYTQQHYQLYYSYMLNSNWTLNTAFDYTHGFGYTESYKRNQYILGYGIDTLAMGFTTSDLIYRKYMVNDAYTAILSTRYENDAFNMNLGGSYQLYDGDHYGHVIWLQQEKAHNGTTVSSNTPFTDWYLNSGLKQDAVGFAKFNYNINPRLNLYADMQVRYIKYNFHGTDDDYGQLDHDTTYLFFNPKIGINYQLNSKQRLYAVASLGNREPARADIKEALYYHRTMKHETLLDIELGYQLQNENFRFESNLYAMLYKNQLTPNGLVTESNYALMENVDKSYRLGIELVSGYRINKHFSLDGNLTLSTNKIVDYNADLSLAWGSPVHNMVNFGQTDLAQSPSIVGAAIFTYRPVEPCKLQIIGKYVGEQYADNTGRIESKLDDYFLLNARASYSFKLQGNKTIDCRLAVNNILNKNYRTSAWCGTYYDPSSGDFYTDRGYFQQPGINFMAGVSLGF